MSNYERIRDLIVCATVDQLKIVELKMAYGHEETFVENLKIIIHNQGMASFNPTLIGIEPILGIHRERTHITGIRLRFNYFNNGCSDDIELKSDLYYPVLVVKDEESKIEKYLNKNNENKGE